MLFLEDVLMLYFDKLKKKAVEKQMLTKDVKQEEKSE